VVALTGCTITPATAATVPNITVGSQQEGIWVTGQGEVQAVPDVAVLTLGVQAQAPSVSEAQEQARQAMDALMAALRASGIDEKDIQTTGYNIWQQTRWDPNRQVEEPVGYQVSNTVRVKVRQVEDAGAVIDATVAAAGDLIRVQGIYFEVDDPSSYLDEARAKAVADAKKRAEQLASLAGVTLGKPTYITESYYTPVIYRGIEAAMPESAAGAPTPIMPGETTISANVQIVYSIQ